MNKRNYSALTHFKSNSFAENQVTKNSRDTPLTGIGITRKLILDQQNW